MSAFMVVAVFRPGTEMREVFAVAADEAAQVESLRAEGRLGAVHLSLARGTVFFELDAPDVAGASAVIESLPMARWWDVEVYPIAVPVIPG